MAIQSRRGNKVNFDKDKMLPGEFGVALDTQEAFICFGAGLTKKMATDEDYADMMEECVTATENAQNVVDSFNNLEIEKLAIDDAKVSLITGWSSDKISKHDTKDNVTTFTESTSIANISSGEKHSVIFGKIRKLISSIKQVALTGSYTDLSNTPSLKTVATSGNYDDLTNKPIVNSTAFPTPSADTLGKIYHSGTELKITLRSGSEGNYTYSWVPFISKDKVVNNFTVTEDGFVADARGLKVLKDGLDGVNNNLLLQTITPTQPTQSNYAIAYLYAYKKSGWCFLKGQVTVTTQSTSLIEIGTALPTSSVGTINSWCTGANGQNVGSLGLSVSNGTISVRYGDTGKVYQFELSYPCS